MNIVAFPLRRQTHFSALPRWLASLSWLPALAWAGEAEPSRLATQIAVVLIAVTLVAMTGFAFWSWRRRRGLADSRRQAERAWRASEERLRHVTNQLPIAVFQYRGGMTPGFDYISEGVRRLAPVTAAELAANPQRLLAAVHADDRGGLAWLAGGEPPAPEVDWIGRVAAGEGRWRWLHLRATTDLAADGSRAISGVLADVTQLKAAQLALERSRSELRRLAAHRESRIEQERQRLAREFHDELGQVLTAARMQLQLLQRQAAEDGAAAELTVDKLHAVEDLIGEAYRSVKLIASDLRPAALNLGLTAAVEWLAERLLRPAGIPYRIEFAAAADDLPEEQAIVLFRIIQESVNNIVRHAAAHEVRLSFTLTPSGGQLRIADDGCGFDPAGVDRQAHFGLLGMAERVAAFGGTLDIASRPGAGTTLTIVIP